MADTPNMQDVKAKVSSLDMPGKLLLFGGLAGLVGTFLSWYSVSFSGGDDNPIAKAMAINLNHHVQGIDVGEGKLTALACVVAIATLGHSMFASIADAQKALYKKIQLGAAALAVVCAVWFWIDVESPATSDGVSAGFGLGFWISLLGAGAAAYGAFQRFKAPTA